MTPRKVLALTPEQLRAAGLSKSKATYVHKVAEWFVANAKTAKNLATMTDEDIITAPTSIPGIGVWSANVFLIFNLGRLDIMPASDLGIRRGVELAYGLKDLASAELVHKKAERWKPYRSIASLYLWNALKLKLSTNGSWITGRPCGPGRLPSGRSCARRPVSRSTSLMRPMIHAGPIGPSDHGQRPQMTANATVKSPSSTAPRAPKPAPKVGFVSLGCPKALVDSERIITKLRSEGYQVAPDYADADVVVVNTCGFLDSAKQESLDAIGEAMAENGRVIVTGCMGVEEGRIRAEHPGVLAVTGPHQYEQVVTAVHDAVPPLHDPYIDLVPPEGLRLTPRHYAYLKISEGCNNRCSFCIIPSIRGDLASRPANHVMTEAERLVKAGVKELLVISQDTSAYGLDIKYAESSGRARRSRRGSRISPRRSAHSASGCACTTSIPTRTWTTSFR